MSVKISRYPKKFGVLIEPQIEFTIVESISISYDMSWESIPVYGRQDAIQNYKTTGQTLSAQVAMVIDDGATLGGKKYDTVALFRYTLKSLNSLARPVYEGDVIVQSPLWKVMLFPDLTGNVGLGYAEGQNEVVIAPQSISVDYGDRLRKIDALRGASIGDLDFENMSLDEEGESIALPKRLAISFSGPIINTKPVFINRGRTRANSSSPLVEPDTPQDKSKTTKITK
jgi:hypothetical protein